MSLRQIITSDSSRGAAAMTFGEAMTMGMTTTTTTTTTGPLGAGTG